MRRGYPSAQPTLGTGHGGTLREARHSLVIVHSGNAWSGSQKGWFNLAYYEGGASYGQGSGYIYTSFQKTAKIWWDPWQGGAGAIYSTIDGSGSGYPIAEVNNCSRVIKYVVTVGQRYSTYSLVDMRVHDMNVVADLTRHDPTAPNPNEPVPCDGTDTGLSEGTDDSQLPSFDSLVGQLQVWWTGLWPRVHVKFSKTAIAGPSLVLHFSASLLPLDFIVEEASFSLGMALGMTQGTTQDPVDDPMFVEQIISNLITMFLATWQSKVAMWIAALITGRLCQLSMGNPALLQWAMIAIGIYLALFLVDLMLNVARVLANYQDPITRFYTLFYLGMLGLFGFIAVTFIAPLIYYEVAKHAGLGQWYQDRSLMSILYIWVKLGLAMSVFAAALIVAGMTWVGWV